MAYFIFLKNSNDLSKIAENQIDLDNLNIEDEHFKTIEVSQSDFDAVKYQTKLVNKLDGNTVIYSDTSVNFADKPELSSYIDIVKIQINHFLYNNKNDIHFQKWNDYRKQLSSLDLNSITYPLNMSLEQYFNQQNKPSLNPLQLP